MATKEVGGKTDGSWCWPWGGGCMSWVLSVGVIGGGVGWVHSVGMRGVGEGWGARMGGVLEREILGWEGGTGRRGHLLW